MHSGNPKRSYEKPTLHRRDRLSGVIAAPPSLEER